VGRLGNTVHGRTGQWWERTTLRLEPGASFFFSFVIKKFVAVAKAKTLAPARDLGLSGASKSA